jgi:hypothetical protein
LLENGSEGGAFGSVRLARCPAFTAMTVSGRPSSGQWGPGLGIWRAEKVLAVARQMVLRMILRVTFE